jgi:Recombinase
LCRITQAGSNLRTYQGGFVGSQGSWETAGGVERMRVARGAQAAQFAANALPIIRNIQAVGHTSFNAIAAQLNARKVATANGGRWRHVQVRQILDRAASGKQQAVLNSEGADGKPWTRRR